MDNDAHEYGTRPLTEKEEALTGLLRRGARDLLKQAVEAVLHAFLDDQNDQADHRVPDSRRAVVRKGHQPEGTIQIRIGDLPVRLSKTQDCLEPACAST